MIRCKPSVADSVRDNILTIIAGECKKKKKTYKQQSFHTLSMLLETFQDIDEEFDFLEKVWPLIHPILESTPEEEKKKEGGGGEKEAEAVVCRSKICKSNVLSHCEGKGEVEAIGEEQRLECDGRGMARDSRDATKIQLRSVGIAH